MAATTCKIICLLLIFVFVAQGNGQCNIEQDVKVVQYFTYNLTNDIPRIEAIVTNNCSCEISDVKLSCGGFKSNTTLDSSKIKKTGDVCLLNSGNALLSNQGFLFSYNWFHFFNFKIISAEMGECA